MALPKITDIIKTLGLLFPFAYTMEELLVLWELSLQFLIQQCMYVARKIFPSSYITIIHIWQLNKYLI